MWTVKKLSQSARRNLILAVGAISLAGLGGCVFHDDHDHGRPAGWREREEHHDIERHEEEHRDHDWH